MQLQFYGTKVLDLEKKGQVETPLRIPFPSQAIVIYLSYFAFGNM